MLFDYIPEVAESLWRNIKALPKEYRDADWKDTRWLLLIALAQRLCLEDFSLKAGCYAHKSKNTVERNIL